MSRNRKEFKKINMIMKILLKKMYKQYGYDLTVIHIENMTQPTNNEKLLMIEYINELNNKGRNDKMESTI